MAFIPPIGSTVAFQSNATKLVATVSVVGIDFSNTSVVTVPKGSITALQGTNPWQVNVPTPSYISYQAAGSVLAVSGSFSGGNSSVQLLGGVAPIGSVAVLQGTNPWQINVPSPSMIAYQLAGSVLAVAATVNTGNSSVQLLGGIANVGSVTAIQGTNPWQVNMPSPSIISYQLAGSIMAVSATVNTGNSSVLLLGGVAVIGSVATLQGTNPWVIGNSSVLALQGTLPWVIQSIVGTYAEDAGHTNNDKGIFDLGVRNDTISSLSSADLDYTPKAVDSSGRLIIKPFVSEDGTIISFQGSVVSGSVVLIAPSVTGKRNYITDFYVANTGSVATLITFQGGDTSILGYTIAPGGGGSNAPGMAIPWKTTPGQDLAFKASTPVSVLYMTVKGFNAP